MSQILKPPCVRCMKPSDDSHHGRPDDLNMGKGMGGTAHDDSEHFTMLDLCRGCHDRAHAKTTIFELFDEDGEQRVRWTDMGGKTGQRPLVLLPEQTDEQMAHQWEQAQSLGQVAMVMQARLAYEWFRRYGGHDRWWHRVAELIRDTTGLPVSVGVIYDRAALGTLLAASPDVDPALLVSNLGVKVAAQAGRAIAAGADPDTVIDFAERTRDSGTKMTTTAALVKQEFLGGTSKPPPSDIITTLLDALKAIYEKSHDPEIERIAREAIEYVE